MGNSLKDKCEAEFYDSVHLRDGGRCQTCREYGAEAHHIIPKSHNPPASVLYDVDFGVLLCPAGHRGDARGGCDKASAPQVSPKLFDEKVLPLLLNGMDPARAAKIRSQRAHIWTRSKEKPDYKAILAGLIKRKKKKYKMNWMDDDCEFMPAM